MFFPDQLKGAKEMHRVLKSSGRAIAITWIPTNHYFFRIMKRVMGVLIQHGVTPPPPTALALDSHEAVKALFIDAGFAKVETHAAVHQFVLGGTEELAGMMFTNPVTQNLRNKLSAEHWEVFSTAMLEALKDDTIDRTAEAILVVAEK